MAVVGERASKEIFKLCHDLIGLGGYEEQKGVHLSERKGHVRTQ